MIESVVNEVPVSPEMFVNPVEPLLEICHWIPPSPYPVDGVKLISELPVTHKLVVVADAVTEAGNTITSDVVVSVHVVVVLIPTTW